MSKFEALSDWKGLLFRHCEKMVAAVIGVIVVGFIWNAIRQEQLPHNQKPNDFKELIEGAKHHMTVAKYEEWSDRPVLKDYQGRSIMDEIGLAAYEIETPFKPQTVETKEPRFDPELFTIQKIEAHSGYGAFAMQDPEKDRREVLQHAHAPDRLKDVLREPAIVERALPENQPNRVGGVKAFPNDEIKGAFWAVITGIFLESKQIEEYDRAFKKAMGYDPRDDIPLYKAYIVERAEVSDDGETGNWERHEIVKLDTLKSMRDLWAVEGEDPADRRYHHPRFTYPVGPLLLKDWSEDVVHSSVPLEARAMAQRLGRLRRELQEQQKSVEEKVLFEDVVQDNAALARILNEQDRHARALLNAKVEPETKMFRYFDFKVKPGKRYRYRVQLVLRDPNGAREVRVDEQGAELPPFVPDKYLAPEVRERLKPLTENQRQYRFTEMSEPSPIVEIPQAHRVVARSVEPASENRVYDEPKAKVGLTIFDLESGKEASYGLSLPEDSEDAEIEFMRGTVLDFTASAQAIDPRTASQEKLDSFEFQTGKTLLDIQGGGKIPQSRTLTEPAELLFVDENGNLLVRSELESMSLGGGETKGVAPSPGRERPENPLGNDGGLLGGS